MHKNKGIGRAFEKKIVSWFAEMFGLIPLIKSKSGTNLNEAQIARAEEVNQHLDNLGIDVWFTPNLSLSDLQIQCKSTLCTGIKGKTIDVQALFEMPEGFNVLMTEIKYRPKGKKNMMKWGEVVTMTPETFKLLLDCYIKTKENG